MDLNEMLVFSKVVDAGSFTRGALWLGLPKSTVSRKVTNLEERLGVRLLHRTTRHLQLTEIGRFYYERCLQIIQDAEEAELAVTQLQQTPIGYLRLTAPVDFALTFLGSMLANFLKRYPDVTIDMEATDRLVDLVREGFDIGIRIGKFPDSSLIARQLTQANFNIYASNEYLQKAGRPKQPHELAQHSVIHFPPEQAGKAIKLSKNNKTVEVPITTRLTVNSLTVARDAALDGLGIAILPEFVCAQKVKEKKLKVLLADWALPSSPIYAVYPSRRHLSAKVQVFLNFLTEQFQHL